MNNEELYKAALKAINELFSDRSVSKEKAVDNLESLREEIDILIETLQA